MIANQKIRTTEKSCKITSLKNRTEKKKLGEILATQAKIFPEFAHVCLLAA